MIPVEDIAKITEWSNRIKLFEVNNWGDHKYTKIIFNDGTIKVTNRYFNEKKETYVYPSDLSLNEIADLYYRSKNGR
jgi:hypothetical protein